MYPISTFQSLPKSTVILSNVTIKISLGASHSWKGGASKNRSLGMYRGKDIATQEKNKETYLSFDKIESGLAHITKHVVNLRHRKVHVLSMQRTRLKTLGHVAVPKRQFQ